jgi:hypothetical protein
LTYEYEACEVSKAIFDVPVVPAKLIVQDLLEEQSAQNKSTSVIVVVHVDVVHLSY